MIAKAIEKLGILLQGKIPEKINSAKIDNPNDRQFTEVFNQLIAFMEEIHQFIVPLARGELGDVKLSPKNFLASPFKELHSRLRHLTWQAKQVASGDYAQRVDFMGDFSEAFNFMIIALERNERLLKEKIEELEQALGHIKKLEGILPICSYCKRIRNQGSKAEDQRSWIKLENYLTTRTDARFSHSICPGCLEKYFPEFAEPGEDKP
jgi:soluble cytochrome b562